MAMLGFSLTKENSDLCSNSLKHITILSHQTTSWSRWPVSESFPCWESEVFSFSHPYLDHSCKHSPMCSFRLAMFEWIVSVPFAGSRWCKIEILKCGSIYLKRDPYCFGFPFLRTWCNTSSTFIESVMGKFCPLSISLEIDLLYMVTIQLVQNLLLTLIWKLHLV